MSKSTDNIVIDGPVAYMEESQAAVFFSGGASTAGGAFKTSGKGTVAPIKQLQNALDLAFWGEDNRFPQNIEQQMAYCGVGKAGLNKKIKQLWGDGIMPGKIIDYQDEGRTEVFQPLDRTKNKVVYDFIENRRMFRFWLEYLQDWVWFSNCFPELVLGKDGKTIANLVHQESCDSRFKQMNDEGNMPSVFLSKLWGAAKDQYAKFDPEKAMLGLMENSTNLASIDNKFIKTLDCVDMYDPVDSLKAIATKLTAARKPADYKSAILPTNYPAVNKTYYQVPAWDGARLGGWVEIACKIPAILKRLFNQAFSIKYHIEVPEIYFEKVYGKDPWDSMEVPARTIARKKLLKEMNAFLSGDKNAYKTFISFFDTDPITKEEYGHIKITSIEDKANLDKELITSSAADTQILIAMEVHPNQLGAGTIGNGQQRSGGSDIREAGLMATSGLNLERNVFLEPLYLVRDYNREVGGMKEWESDIVFRIRDTVLTTLDTGAGTTKVVS